MNKQTMIIASLIPSLSNDAYCYERDCTRGLCL